MLRIYFLANIKLKLAFVAIILNLISILYLVYQEPISINISNYMKKNYLIPAIYYCPTNITVKTKIENSKWIIMNSENEAKYATEFLVRHDGFKLIVVDKLLEKCSSSLDIFKTFFNEYNSKNIGYLYAIKNGAEFIYDTESGIMPFAGLNESFSFNEHDYGPMLECDAPTWVNPYSHFGQVNYKPYGFPSKINSSNIYLCGKRKTSLVQQGMINGDNYNNLLRLNDF